MFPVAGLVAVAALVRDPAVGYPVLAMTLFDVAPIDPHVMVAAVGPITRGVDVPVAWGGLCDDSWGGWGNLNVDNGRLGQ